MSRLPPEILAVVDEVLRLSRRPAAELREVRADLEQYFRDGLAAGRTVEELIARFGDPKKAARQLTRTSVPHAPPPRPSRRTGSSTAVGALWADMRFGLRMLVKRPTLTITTTVVLALGIGANTVVFTIMNELLLSPLPVADQSTLVDVWPDVPGGNSFLGFSYIDFERYQDASRTLETLAAFAAGRMRFGDGQEGRTVVGQMVSPEYFRMLGLLPLLGTLAFPPEGDFGDDPTAILSHRFWQDAFGGDPSVIGHTLRLEGHAVTVVGVGPAGFSGHFIGFPTDLWLPITAAPAFMPGFDPDDPGDKPLEMIGRLRENVAPEAARAELNAIAERLEDDMPDTNRGHRVGVTPTTGIDHSLRASVTTLLAILGAVSALVLIIACLNVGSILLVRAMSREREMAIRLAIGAGRARLARQLLVETCLVAVLGAVLGTWVAVRLNAALAELVRGLTGGLGPDLSLDGRVLTLTAAAALVAAFLAGGAPMLHILRKDPASALHARPGGGAAAGTRMRAGLVVGQVAVSVVLVIATGLLVRGLIRATLASPGFDADRIASFTLALDDEEPGLAAHLALRGRLLEALTGLPGVERVTFADGPPIGVARTPVVIEMAGVEPPPGEDELIVDTRMVGAAYLGTLGIPLWRGRDFLEQDARDGPPVAVVSRAFVERFWPADEAIGRSLLVGETEALVVGVAENARYLVQDDTPDPIIYVSSGNRPIMRPHITMRAAEPLSLAASVRPLVADIVRGREPVELSSARSVLRDALLPRRLGALLVGSMGLTALLLAAVGLYGLVHFTVMRSAHEFGVRMALGGSRRHVLSVVLRKGLLPAIVGMVIGGLLALPTTRVLERFLAGVSPADPLTYATVMAVFILVAVLASWMPARRAARIDPTEALRGE